MKNKLRKIIVNNKEYFWYVKNPNCDGDGGCQLKIFKDKKVIYDDITNKIITPKIIRKIIMEL